MLAKDNKVVFAVVIILVFVAYQLLSETSSWRVSRSGGGDAARLHASKWQSADGTADCLRSFCVWNNAKSDFVVHTPPPKSTPKSKSENGKESAPDRAAISAALRAKGPNPFAQMPPKPNAARALGGADFARRDAAYHDRFEEWWTREPAIQHMLSRAAKSEADNSLWSVADGAYPRGNEAVSPHHERGGDLPNVWHMYRPMWTCVDEDRIGDPMDGGKWICAPRAMPKTDCVVYSYGSNLQFDFEAGIHAGSPQCEIHVFDPTISAVRLREHERDSSKPAIPDFVTYHYVGLTHESSASGHGIVSELGLLESLSDTMTRLGHDHIDLLKVDVEGHEWAWMAQLEPALLGRVDELLIELHFHGLVKAKKFFDKLFAAHYRIFHFEPNQFSADARFGVEYALIRIAPEAAATAAIAAPDAAAVGDSDDGGSDDSSTQIQH